VRSARFPVSSSTDFVSSPEPFRIPLDFFDAQDHAKQLSQRLILLFGMAVLGMVAVVYASVAFAVGLTREGQGVPLDPGLLLLVSAAMGLVIGSGALYRTASLRKGGGAVAELLGGRRVDPGTRDPQERVLVNLVEEMSIASGVPLPSIYILDRELGINAFAAGHTAEDAAVAVTRGTLEGLTRDELQGVIAHEFSHILNGDMRLNIRLMGLLYGILLVAVIGRGILRGVSRGGGSRGRSGGRGNGAQLAVLGGALVAVGYLGVFFGRLIQAAVSRQREFLADAAAVQFTRNPEGIANALKRIGLAAGMSEGRGGKRALGSQLRDSHAQEASHLFFADGIGRSLSQLTATHPPLPERILRVQPRWDGNWDVPKVRSAAPSPRESAASPQKSGIPIGASAAVGGGGGLLAFAGSPGPEHVSFARSLLERFSDSLRDALHSTEGAVAVTLALLLDSDPALREDQMVRIRGEMGGEVAEAARALQSDVLALGPEGRLPILELAIPRLRTVDPARAPALGVLVGDLIRADGVVRPFEFALFHILQRNLGAGGGEVRKRLRSTPRTPLSRLHQEAERLLSAMARTSSSTPDKQAEAFRRGVRELPGGEGAWTFQPPHLLGLDAVDEALGRMEEAVPEARKALLQAASAILHADGEVEVEEAELFRAMAEALEVPIPPLHLGRSR